MRTNTGKSDLTYLHGIRVLSLFWIILLHVATEKNSSFWPYGKLIQVYKLLNTVVDPTQAHQCGTLIFLFLYILLFNKYISPLTYLLMRRISQKTQLRRLERIGSCILMGYSSIHIRTPVFTLNFV